MENARHTTKVMDIGNILKSDTDPADPVGSGWNVDQNNLSMVG